MSQSGKSESKTLFCGIRTIQEKGDSLAITLPKSEIEEQIEGKFEDLEGIGVRATLRECGSYKITIPLD